jgi:hydroxyethylthiazole kinase-like uncharacterized protein yjeF
MELAGLACAQAFAKTFPLLSHKKVIVCCGPGNQGGDGLVAARHLHHFRYKPTIYLPKPGSKEIYQRLLLQCENLEIPVINDVNKFKEGLRESDAILDAVFGTYPNFQQSWMESANDRFLFRSACPKTFRHGIDSHEREWSTDIIRGYSLRMACRGRTSGQ